LTAGRTVVQPPQLQAQNSSCPPFQRRTVNSTSHIGLPNDSGASQSHALPSPRFSKPTPVGKPPQPEPEPDNMESPPHAQTLDQSPPRKRKLEDIRPAQDAEVSPKRVQPDGEKPRRPAGRDKGKRPGRGEFLYVWRALYASVALTKAKPPRHRQATPKYRSRRREEWPGGPATGVRS
jgi:hypothetical protein